MLRGLSKAGLGALESQRELIELAGRYGFQSVELDPLALVEEYGREEAQRLLSDHHVVLASFGLPVEWRATEEKFLEDLEKLTTYAAAAQALGCASCCTYVLPSTDEKAAHFMAVATRRLRECAVLLAEYGISLGLEFVGPHHLRTRWANPFIWTLNETLDWIDAIGEPNVGLLLDSYHWYTTGLDASDIEALLRSQIVHVHLNDAPSVPVEEALDNGRLFPGEGVIDLNSFLRALEHIGYDGSVTQEILSSSPPTGTPEELAKRSKDGFDNVFAAAGLNA
ncbi:sugar phosphate isomerase/epimerase family protein [Paenibacillus paeoniae]|uniref:Sugar phosphate isomerase/epimerase n=1 Tax=Paenibacillus paeoniae TaxID=2292705 RepID=A0A371PK23_9BACL|nr:sugar phosphate isomerase/epimerase family protein [Paenibacillus paeoniae]REK76127.1 sugar phosphate isomerase/epimerase [Paenibacillus paeoniae]